MEPIIFIDRKTGRRVEEKVYGGQALKLLYGKGFSSFLFGKPLAYLASCFPFFSAFYGYLQKLPSSRKKILPFIQEYEVDTEEFLDAVESYASFNDFFIRKLKPSARPLAEGVDVAIIPADGRYLFYQNLDEADGFVVKGQKFSLEKLLGDSALASRYRQGTLVMARLCPCDYHRFHFPCAGMPGESRLMNGCLYSVNPIALKQNAHIFTENRRRLCELDTDRFGKVLYLEVGATNVGSIHETYTPFQAVTKGAEKGYFSFGGSALILLFEPGALTLHPDLTTHPHNEIRCLLGQPLGKAK